MLRQLGCSRVCDRTRLARRPCGGLTPERIFIVEFCGAFDSSWIRGNCDAVTHLGHKSIRVSHGASNLTGFRSTWAAAVTLWRVGSKVRERATAAKTCSKLDCSELGVHLVSSHSFGKHRQDHSRRSCLREPACSAVAGPRSSRPGTTFDRAFYVDGRDPKTEFSQQ